MHNDNMMPEGGQSPQNPDSHEPEAPIHSSDEPININEADLDQPKPAGRRLGNPLASSIAKFKLAWTSWNKRKRWLVASGTVLVLLAIAGGLVFAFAHKSKPTIPRAPQVVTKNSQPVTVASPLTGLQVAPNMAQRPVTAIMIENSLDARPQSGLQDAGVIFEAQAEGGVTRFMALYQEARPEYIGPVRSLRPYFIDWETPFDASVAHVGGSPDALAQIRAAGQRDLDEFFNAGAYWRISSRYAPHNVYTSFDRLDSLNEAKGYTTSSVSSFPRKKESPLKTPSVTSIDLAISGPDYNVHYDYDAKTNSYARSEGGAPHMDLVSASDTTGVQLKPKVVVAMVVPRTNGPLDSSGAYYSDYAVSGSGTAYVFQDGGVTQGTWSKSDRGSQIVFEDTAGAPIKFDPGQTWITVLSATSQVSYK